MSKTKVIPIIRNPEELQRFFNETGGHSHEKPGAHRFPIAMLPPSDGYTMVCEERAGTMLQALQEARTRMFVAPKDSPADPMRALAEKLGLPVQDLRKDETAAEPTHETTAFKPSDIKTLQQVIDYAFGNPLPRDIRAVWPVKSDNPYDHGINFVVAVKPGTGDPLPKAKAALSRAMQGLMANTPGHLSDLPGVLTKAEVQAKAREADSSIGSLEAMLDEALDKLRAKVQANTPPKAAWPFPGGERPNPEPGADNFSETDLTPEGMARLVLARQSYEEELRNGQPLTMKPRTLVRKALKGLERTSALLCSGFAYRPSKDKTVPVEGGGPYNLVQALLLSCTNNKKGLSAEDQAVHRLMEMVVKNQCRDRYGMGLKKFSKSEELRYEDANLVLDMAVTFLVPF